MNGTVMTMKTFFNFIAATMLGMSVLWLTGCPSSSDPVVTTTNTSSFGETPTTDIPTYDPVINGSALFCSGAPVYVEGDTNLEAPAAPSEDPEATGIPRWNISKTPDEPNIGNNVRRLAIAVKAIPPVSLAARLAAA